MVDTMGGAAHTIHGAANTKSGKFDFFLTLPFISAYVAVQYFTVS